LKISFISNIFFFKIFLCGFFIYLTGCSSSIYSNSDITYKASKSKLLSENSYTLYVDPAEQFNPSLIDRTLYNHQKVGKRYKIMGNYYTPKHEPYYDVVGVASWYGDKFHGKPTATGEIYNQYDLTVAHKTLPLNSLLYVTNLENGKSLMLRLNDRGPFIGNRIIDLSFAAAKALGTTEKGLAKVRVQYAGPANKKDIR
jgi:rare lipoprotein A (peptidoglycan hydrolase)